MPTPPTDIYATRGEWYQDRYWITQSYVYITAHQNNRDSTRRMHFVKIVDAWDASPNGAVVYQSGHSEDYAYASAIFARLTTDMAATMAAIALDLNPIGDLFDETPHVLPNP